jgi:predicted NBD/HSP70 family sugar kinase
MDEILFKLLEQTPVIIALSLGIFALWKDKKETKVEMTAERKALRKEIKETKERHALHLKELNTYIRERDQETLGALQEVTSAVSTIQLMLNDKLRLLD